MNESIISWKSAMQHYTDHQSNLTQTMSTTLNTPTLEARLISAPINSINKDSLTKLLSHITHQLKILHSTFIEPNRLIRKRREKQLDFDRLRDVWARNALKELPECPDALLVESADVYVVLNAQLVLELPEYLENVLACIEAILGLIVNCHIEFYQLCVNEYSKGDDTLINENTHHSIATAMGLKGAFEIKSREITSLNAWHERTWRTTYVIQCLLIV